MVVALWRFTEGFGLGGDGVYDFGVCGFEQVIHEVVRALCFDVELVQGAAGEVSKVVRDDGLGAAADGSGDDVAVVLVGEFDCSDEGLISGDKAVGHGSDHELAGSFEAGWVKLGVRSDDAGRHLVEDGMGPLSAVKAGACEPDQQVAQRRRV